MEILNSNFDQSLRVVLNSVENSDFVSIDCEFTGLFHSEEDAFDESDCLEDRYWKLKKSCDCFFMCQLGLTTFSLEPSSNSYRIRVFTFYTLPDSRSRALEISTSSMKFLVDHGFDMNKLFKSGIPCVRLSQASILPKESKSSISKLGEFSNEQVMVYVNLLMNFVNGSENSIDLEFVNYYQKFLIIGSCGALKHFKNLVYGLVDFNDGKNVIRVSKVEGKEPILSPPQLNEEYTDNEQIFSELGVSVVFSAILNSRKPIVLHNGLFDLGYLYSHFIGNLPESLAEFKNDVRNLFPDIYDTKTLAKTIDGSPFKRLNLEGLYNSCCKMPELKERVRYFVDDEFSGLLGNNLHEAGYDSFLTGVIFLNLQEYLKQLGNFTNIWEAVQKYVNCICLNKINRIYLNLNFTDKKQPDNILRSDNLVKFCTSKQMTINSISDYFCKFGDVYIKKLKSNEYFVKYDRIYAGYTLKSIIEYFSSTNIFIFS